MQNRCDGIYTVLYTSVFFYFFEKWKKTPQIFACGGQKHSQKISPAAGTPSGGDFWSLYEVVFIRKTTSLVLVRRPKNLRFFSTCIQFSFKFPSDFDFQKWNFFRPEWKDFQKVKKKHSSTQKPPCRAVQLLWRFSYLQHIQTAANMISQLRITSIATWILAPRKCSFEVLHHLHFDLDGAGRSLDLLKDRKCLTEQNLKVPWRVSKSP